MKYLFILLIITIAGTYAGNCPNSQTIPKITAYSVIFTKDNSAIPLPGKNILNFTIKFNYVVGNSINNPSQYFNQKVSLQKMGLDSQLWNISVNTIIANKDTVNYSLSASGPLYSEATYNFDFNLIHVNFDCLMYTLPIELIISCDDGNFCDGVKRLVGGECLASSPPCGYQNLLTNDCCMAYQCFNNNKTCSKNSLGYAANGTCNTQALKSVTEVNNQCGICDYDKCNPKCKRSWECGVDGCNRGCTVIGNQRYSDCSYKGPGYSCINNKCLVLSNNPGTCRNPLPLFGDLPSSGSIDGYTVPSIGTGSSDLIVNGDTSTGEDQVIVWCNPAAVKEKVYRFKLNNKQGVQFMVTAANGDPCALDTLLALYKGNCTNPLDYATGTCSDDATPPGCLSSRLFAVLDPGEYSLVVSGYSSSNVGPYTLSIHFNGESCVPQCDGKRCGSDGCNAGHRCGVCDSSNPICTLSGFCIPETCTLDCQARSCGDSINGCPSQPTYGQTLNGTVIAVPGVGDCGQCVDYKECELKEGKCVPIKECDSLKPVCNGKNRPLKSPNSWCGSDCQWHKLDEPLMDLIPNAREDVLPTIVIEYKTFAETSCAFVEGCVSSPGSKLLMRFGTQIHNIGEVSFLAPPISANPQLYEFSSCHAHYHKHNFARTALKDLNGTIISNGYKLAYCMEDSYSYQLGPNIACLPKTSCELQGMQKGWTDNYGNNLDCQWIEIPRDIMNKTVTMIVETNLDHSFQEYTYKNNRVEFEINMSHFQFPPLEEMKPDVSYPLLDFVKPSELATYQTVFDKMKESKKQREQLKLIKIN